MAHHIPPGGFFNVGALGHWYRLNERYSAGVNAMPISRSVMPMYPLAAIRQGVSTGLHEVSTNLLVRRIHASPC